MNQPVPSQHVCFSGSLSCSGCNPCSECQAYVQEQVLPSAFIASRMNETLVTALSLVGVLIERGVDPRQLGIDFSRLFSSLEEQADAFFGGYNEGWQRMHEGMRTNPAVRNRLKISQVGGVPEGWVQPGGPGKPTGAHHPPPPPYVKEPEPKETSHADEFVNPWQDALRKQQEQWDAEDAQEASVEVEPPKPPPLVPLTVDEVAAAGFPVPGGVVRNGAS